MFTPLLFIFTLFYGASAIPLLAGSSYYPIYTKGTSPKSFCSNWEKQCAYIAQNSYPSAKPVKDLKVKVDCLPVKGNDKLVQAYCRSTYTKTNKQDPGVQELTASVAAYRKTSLSTMYYRSPIGNPLIRYYGYATGNDGNTAKSGLIKPLKTKDGKLKLPNQTLNVTYSFAAWYDQRFEVATQKVDFYFKTDKSKTSTLLGTIKARDTSTAWELNGSFKVDKKLCGKKGELSVIETSYLVESPVVSSKLADEDLSQNVRFESAAYQVTLQC